MHKGRTITTNQEINIILSKLTAKEKQQVTYLVKLNEIVTEFIHKDETEVWEASKLPYEKMIMSSAYALAESQDITKLSDINYANAKLSELTGYSKCLSDLASELFPIHYKYNNEV